ncbi:MAG TPA: hypothetical protein ENJ79_05770 [Gammaproteobacteria bacterium]|nr:hypothetical protein [Gammaproteobacteria bacterium]
MAIRSISVWFRASLVLAAALGLSACGGGGSGANSAAGGGSTVVSGSVGDGPVSGAEVRIHDRNGELLQVVTSDTNANYAASIEAAPDAYPLYIVVRGGTDMVTGRAPDFVMTSVVTSPFAKVANINPFSTLIVETARRKSGGLNRANLDWARQIVTRQLNFGLDPAFVPDPVGTPVTDANVAVIVKASETLGEMIRRTRDALLVTSSVASADDVVQALASDLVDGTLDGAGASRANPRVTAAANLVAGQVLVEAMGNRLRVDGAVATSLLDAAIANTHPGVPASRMSGSVRVNTEMLDQARVATDAARALAPAATLDTVAGVLDALTPGTTAASVQNTLPPSPSTAFDQAILSTRDASNADLDRVNRVIVSGGGTGGGTGGGATPPNRAPTLSGSPASSVAEDSAYSFRPSAADADGDALVFSILNRPAWARFNAATGQFSGTPRNADVGLYSGIEIRVSDGRGGVASIGPFSIRVRNTNDAPVISGTPATRVDEGVAYNFRPIASDVDGDNLSFSIRNRPAWARFDTSTGRLWGTPTADDAGVYGNIGISVTDGQRTVSLSSFSITVVAAAPSVGNASLSWTAPAARADGAALSMSELAGYTLYYGTAPGNYTSSMRIDDPTASSVVVTDLPVGTYYFVMTARDVDGRESGYSNAISRVVR